MSMSYAALEIKWHAKLVIVQMSQHHKVTAGNGIEHEWPFYFINHFYLKFTFAIQSPV